MESLAESLDSIEFDDVCFKSPTSSMHLQRYMTRQSAYRVRLDTKIPLKLPPLLVGFPLSDLLCKGSKVGSVICHGLGLVTQLAQFLASFC